MKKALVIGAGGFIGHNLVSKLKAEGWYVVGVDLKYPVFQTTKADEFKIADARKISHHDWNEFTRIYQLAADMGGAGFVFTGDNDADILTNSLGINLNILEELAKGKFKGTIFYSSSVCCYPDDVEGKESDAYPANPPSNYGWEKLTSERVYQAYAKNKGIDIRIARFHNCFGRYGTYKGGREKAPAAICRKIAESTGEIEVWGDGEQLRPFIYIEDLLDGIEALMKSDYKEPVNLGGDESSCITINKLVDIVSTIAGKKVSVKHIPGAIGGQKRHANNDLAQKVLGWKPIWRMDNSMRVTYEWINSQINEQA